MKDSNIRISKQKDKELEEVFSCSVWDLDEDIIKKYFEITKREGLKEK